MKNSSDTIGNRTGDLPASSALLQPTTPPRALYTFKLHLLHVSAALATSGRFYINIIIISNLSNDRSKASSKTIPPHSAIQGFLLQLTVSSPVLKVIQQLLTPSSSSSCHFYLLLYLSFNNLLQKATCMENNAKVETSLSQLIRRNT